LLEVTQLCEEFGVPDWCVTELLVGEQLVHLRHLKILLMYEDSADILVSCLRQLTWFIDKDNDYKLGAPIAYTDNTGANRAPIVNRFVQVLCNGDNTHSTNEQYVSDREVMREMYDRKEERQRRLFRGFMRRAISGTNIYVPQTIETCISTFTSSYAEHEFDVLRRLVNLVGGKHNYSLDVRGWALKCLFGFVYVPHQHKDWSTLRQLLRRPGVLPALVNAIGSVQVHKRAYWLVQALLSAVRGNESTLTKSDFWQGFDESFASDLCECNYILVQRFCECVQDENAKPERLSIASVILMLISKSLRTMPSCQFLNRTRVTFVSLLETLPLVQSIILLVEEHVLIVDAAEYLKRFEVPTNGLSAASLMNSVVRTFDCLLDMAETREVCVKQMMTHNAVETLRGIRDSEHLMADESRRSRAAALHERVSAF